jgi:hypothetical protein
MGSILVESRLLYTFLSVCLRRDEKRTKFILNTYSQVG